MDELNSLMKFAGGDPEAAEDAFSHLSSRIERFLWRYLATLVPAPQDREDVIAIVLAKLYSKRSEFEVKSLGSWYAFVALVARRCALDRIPKHESISLSDELPLADQEFIGNVAEMTYFRTLLYSAADGLWLQVDPRAPASERNRKLLAAQLYYLHGRPWEEVCKLVGNDRPLPRKTLDSWLCEPGVLNELAFKCLYVDNDRLTCAILGGDRPLEIEQLRKLSNSADREAGKPPAGWTWREVKVAIWRYRNGLLTEKILQMDPSLTPEDLEQTIAKCRARLPFEAIAVRLAEALDQRNAPLLPLKSPSIWKRLVFQYSSIHELSHKQILERTEAAARVSGFTLTPAMLNSWLSNGRLTQQLATYAKKEKFV